MDKNVQDFLDALDEQNKQVLIDITIPSTASALQFYQLNAQQLRDIVQSVTDTSLLEASFVTTTNAIINDLCLDKLAAKTFTIADKVAILLNLRAKCISPTVKVVLANEREEEVDLAVLCKRTAPNSAPVSITSGDYTVILTNPTITEEQAFVDEFVFDKKDIENQDKLQTAVGQIFLCEIAKYITNVDISTSTSIALSALSAKERVQVIEKLPASVINASVKVIESFKKEISTYLTVSFTKGKNKGQSKEIQVDAAFFV